MPKAPKTEDDSFSRLGLVAQQLQGVKLGPGVVGRNTSIAWLFMVVMLVGVVSSATMHNPWLLGIALGGAIFGTLFTQSINVYFGNKNPGAALLEGAQLLEYQKMAAKGMPVIEDLSTAVPPPPPLPPPSKPEAKP